MNQKMQDKSAVYMPQLDGVRAFAVIFVILAHWFSPFSSTGYIPYGILGVSIFFVLSGFLITGILLHYKRDKEQKNLKTSFYLKKFYVRRILRIFPIYYLFIALILLIRPEIFKGDVWWHCLYLSNIYFAFVKHGGQPVGYWWTLSVEEQFYLVWPFLILLVNKKYLTGCIIAIIIIGPVFRQLNIFHNELNGYLTPSCFDALGLGALLALHYYYMVKVITNIKFNIFFLLSVILILFLARQWHPLSDGIDRFALACFSFLLVYKASKGFSGIMGVILSNPVFMYIGKISYGLYLYHRLIPEFNLNIQSPFWLQVIRVLILLLIASLSYFFLEKPILRLKKYV